MLQQSFTRCSFHCYNLCLLYFTSLFLFTAVSFFFFLYSLVFRHAGPRWQSVKERGGGCHLSVKAVLPSLRPGVLGQLASKLVSVTVEEWMLNNRAYSSALPPGWLASRRDATGRRPEPATIHYFYLRKKGGRARERGGDWVKGPEHFSAHSSAC